MTDRYPPNGTAGTIWLEPDARELAEGLAPGMRIPGRIVLVLEEGRYVLRIRNRNIVMASPLRFQRLQDIELEVRQVHPELRLAPVTGRSGSARGESGRTDLTV